MYILRISVRTFVPARTYVHSCRLLEPPPPCAASTQVYRRANPSSEKDNTAIAKIQKIAALSANAEETAETEAFAKITAKIIEIIEIIENIEITEITENITENIEITENITANIIVEINANITAEIATTENASGANVLAPAQLLTRATIIIALLEAVAAAEGSQPPFPRQNCHSADRWFNWKATTNASLQRKLESASSSLRRS